jgi:hypothetical protein
MIDDYRPALMESKSILDQPSIPQVALSLYEKLENNHLERYFPRLYSKGIYTLAALTELTIADYDEYGIEGEVDKKQLQRLILQQRIELAKLRRDGQSHTKALDLFNSKDHSIDTKRDTLTQESLLSVEYDSIYISNESEKFEPVEFESDSPDESVGEYAEKNIAPSLFVHIRKRPLSQQEKARKERDIVEIGSVESVPSDCPRDLADRCSLTVHEPKLRLDLAKYEAHHSFCFDRVFDTTCNNDDVYQESLQPLLLDLFRGARDQGADNMTRHVSCFVYGQTGSGKTFTLFHPDNGLYMMATREIFNILNQSSCGGSSRKDIPAIQLSFYEIYQGQLYDLLDNRKRVHARQDHADALHIAGLSYTTINSIQAFQDTVNSGLRLRVTGSNGTNLESSRSHAVLTYSFSIPSKNNSFQLCKLSLIDLAGSERAADHQNSFLYDRSSQCKMEGSEINKSLLALKECIRAMSLNWARPFEKSCISSPSSHHIHVPFRSSKLTHVLKGVFCSEYSRACMIATISPSDRHCDHTLNTIRYAALVQEIANTRRRREGMPLSWEKKSETTENSHVKEDSSFESMTNIESIFENSTENQSHFQNTAQHEISKETPSKSEHMVLSQSPKSYVYTPTRYRLLTPTKPAVLSPLSSAYKASDNSPMISRTAKPNNSTILLSPIQPRTQKAVPTENITSSNTTDLLREKIVKDLSLLQIHMKQSKSDINLSILHEELEQILHRFDDLVSSEYS